MKVSRGQGTKRVKAWKRVALMCGSVLSFVILSLAVSSPTYAQTDAADSTGAAAELELSNNVATIEIDGRPYFEVVGTRSIRAASRADMIEKRIVEAAKLSPDAAPRMQMREDPFGIAIYANEELIMYVNTVDSALEGIDAAVVSELRRGQIVDAIEAYRAARTVSAYIRGALLVGLWTLIFAGFTYGLWLLRRRILIRAEAPIEAWVNKLEAQSGKIVDATSVITTQRLLLRAVYIVIIAAAALLYVGQVLNEFPLTIPIASVFISLVANPVLSLLQTGLDELPKLVTLVFIALVTKFILRVTRLIFQNIEIGFFKIEGFETRWVWPTFKILRIVIIAAAVIIAFPYIPGSQSPAFQGFSILFGLMLTLGANSIASNFLNGFTIIYKRSVTEGDRIKVGNYVGIVEKVSMMDTHLRTRENELVSVPNSAIISNEVVNYTQMEGTNGLMLSVSVGIGYEEPPEKIEALLLSAADRVEGIKKTPKPFVQLPLLGGHDVTYELRAYAKAKSAPATIRSNLNRAVLDAFNAAEVQIMTPFYTADPLEPKIAPTGDSAQSEP